MNHKVLIIDDDGDYRKLLERFLGRYDFDIQTADGLETAVKCASEWCPDVMIVDFRFKNNVTGFDILNAMGKNNVEAHVIFVSGYASWELEERIEKYGVFRFLAKSKFLYFLFEYFKHFSCLFISDTQWRLESDDISQNTTRSNKYSFLHELFS